MTEGTAGRRSNPDTQWIDDRSLTTAADRWPLACHERQSTIPAVGDVAVLLGSGPLREE
ncbi:hypothetical protein [Natrinema sp. SYSU A 869]|uniref:hypothetical protein n=1 Tax=Natrinema sp. SYSU A 869 TaxID=2871694 RepID=UPI001CA3F76A|nr:hypothetical protein [Natrinema sp. SYSU A 869]